jgi:hypothetical protein
MAMCVKTSDEAFMLATENGAFVDWGRVESSDSAVTVFGGAVIIDGVELYNPTRREALAAVSNTGNWHHFEGRGGDFTGMAGGLVIGQRNGGTYPLAGFLSDPYLTDITDSAQLDAIADAAMSERGITNLRNKTAEAVTQEATDGSLYTGGITYMWQDDAGETQTEDDDDPVGLILPNHELVVTDGSPRTLSGTATVNPVANIPGTPFLQSTSGDRPTFDAATGLLDFDGVSEYLTADLTGITTRTSLYATYLINTTDTDFGVLAGSAGTSYVGYAKDADASATISALAGTPTYWLDTALASWASRDAVHTAVADGSLHLVEVIFDASNAAWDTLHFGRYGSVYTDGLALPLYLGPDPGVIERNILRKYWKQQFPDLSY